MALFDTVRSWVGISTEEKHCPECGGDMERTHVRSPNDQGHWRGVEADECADCGYAERTGTPASG